MNDNHAMMTADNYVSLVFHHEIMRYPLECRWINPPSAAGFNIQFVPPQFDPTQVSTENPEFYKQMHGYIIKNFCDRIKSREQTKSNLLQVMKLFAKKDIEKILQLYLKVVGREHETSFMDFMGSKSYTRSLKSRMGPMIENLAYMIRKVLHDFAFYGAEIDPDVVTFIKLLCANAKELVEKKD